MNITAISTAALLVVACSPGALYGQSGADSCTAPDSLAGTGSFAFDSSSASAGLEGQAEPLCYFAGQSTVDNDVWFSWTASVSGTATLNTCGSAVDTKLAAYPGAGCPTNGSALACNDDSCGLQSQLQFPVIGGATYVLQVGTFPGAPGGVGQLDLALVPAAAGDDCATPTVISGQGGFAFDNSGATAGLEGQGESLCYVLGSSAVDRDVWYRWTADATGTAVVRTCGAAIDTKIAAYPGALCPLNGSALACNDDGCGAQSVLLVPVTTGTDYMLQIGSFPGASGGAGVLDIAIQPPLSADDCATPQAIAGQGSFAFDTTLATTGLEGQSELLCDGFGTTGIERDVWFAWTADATGDALISTCGAPLDTKLAAYPAGSCPTVGSALACNDDSELCGGVQAEITLPVSMGVSYLLQLGSFPGATGGAGNLTLSIAPAAEPGTSFCACDAGNAPCNNGGAVGRGCANGSAPAGARLAATGTAQVGADTLVLVGTGVPPGQPGLFFQGKNRLNGGAGMTFGDGLRCASGDVRRLGVAFSDAGGTLDSAGLAQPISVLGGVTAGDLRRYQLWYRDPAGSPCGSLFNLSNGYEVQW